MIRETKFVLAFPKANIPSWVYTMSATPLSSTFCLKDLSMSWTNMGSNLPQINTCLAQGFTHYSPGVTSLFCI